MSLRPSWMSVCLGLSMLGLLAACGEKPQTAGTRKADVAAFQGADNGYGTAGWKAGDAASWEEHMKSRSQGQNEYTRTSAP
jgi:hypothetical protein